MQVLATQWLHINFAQAASVAFLSIVAPSRCWYQAVLSSQNILYVQRRSDANQQYKAFDFA
jgi:hypothetical protein